MFIQRPYRKTHRREEGKGCSHQGITQEVRFYKKKFYTLDDAEMLMSIL
jgi:hypothetical protein